MARKDLYRVVAAVKYLYLALAATKYLYLVGSRRPYLYSVTRRVGPSLAWLTVRDENRDHASLP